MASTDPYEEQLAQNQQPLDEAARQLQKQHEHTGKAEEQFTRVDRQLGMADQQFLQTQRQLDEYEEQQRSSAQITERAISLYEQREQQLKLQDECLRRELELVDRFSLLADRLENLLAKWEQGVRR